MPIPLIFKVAGIIVINNYMPLLPDTMFEAYCIIHDIGKHGVHGLFSISEVVVRLFLAGSVLLQAEGATSKQFILFVGGTDNNITRYTYR